MSIARRAAPMAVQWLVGVRAADISHALVSSASAARRTPPRAATGRSTVATCRYKGAPIRTLQP